MPRVIVTDETKRAIKLVAAASSIMAGDTFDFIETAGAFSIWSLDVYSDRVVLFASPGLDEEDSVSGPVAKTVAIAVLETMGADLSQLEVSWEEGDKIVRSEGAMLFGVPINIVMFEVQGDPNDE